MSSCSVWGNGLGVQVTEFSDVRRRRCHGGPQRVPCPKQALAGGRDALRSPATGSASRVQRPLVAGPGLSSWARAELGTSAEAWWRGARGGGGHSLGRAEAVPPSERPVVEVIVLA